MDMLTPRGTSAVPSVILLPLAFVLLLAASAAAVSASSDDDQWWDGFGRAGTTGRIEALVFYEGDLIAAGDFDYAGGTQAFRVAVWNGSIWEPLGDGLGCAVHALAVYGGDLYAGGNCMDTGWPGDPCYNCVHRWDGTSWEPVGIMGIDGWMWPIVYSVTAFEIYNGRLFVGGHFRSEGGNAGDYLIEWDGETWTRTDIELNGPVHSLALYCDLLVIGGAFTRVDTSSVNRIVAWDGSAWTRLATGMDPQDSGDSIAVFALHTYGDRLIAGGNFTDAGGESVDRLASWDGTAWSSLGFHAGEVAHADGPGVYALATYDGDLVVGGLFKESGGGPGNYIALWDGAIWKALGSGMDRRVYCLTAHSGELYAGGDFRLAESEPVYHVARWDGGTWYCLGPDGMGMAGEVGHLVEFDGHVVAAGEFDLAGGTPSSNIALWTGSAWQPLAAGFVKPVHKMTVSGGHLAGVASVAGGIGGKTVKEWDGVAWDVLGEDFTDGIYGLSDYEGSLVASGDDAVYNTGGDIARWNGTSWEAFGRTPKGYIKAFAMFEGDLIAGGWFRAIEAGSEKTDALGIAAWDGSTWRALGEGFEGPHGWAEASVWDLEVYDGTLVAGGIMRRSGEAQLRHVAAWDGSAWTPVGGGFNGRVNALAVYNETLVAGGLFTEADGIKANHVARWNGSEWAPLGSGVDLNVNALAVQDGYLYVGGQFRSAGGHAAYHMARWEDRFPGMVRRFSAVSVEDCVALEWTNPATERFAGTLVRFSMDGYPQDPEGGEPVPNGNEGRFPGGSGGDASFRHVGLRDSGTYYYTAFAYDEILNYSTAAHASAVVADVWAPELAIAILQNPYLTQYIDVYLVGSEPLDTASVELVVNDEAIDIRPVVAPATVLIADYKLEGNLDSVAVSACASDYAHNEACVSTTFRSCHVRDGGPRTIASLDGRLRLVLKPGSVSPGTYVLILPCPHADSDKAALTVSGGPALTPGEGEVPGGYTISPPGLFKGTPARIEYKYTLEDLPPDKTADHLYIEQDGTRRLNCYVDERNQVLIAEVATAGTFRLRSGEPGSSRITDAAFLDVGPCHPNPFSASVRVSYEIRARKQVLASVYDVRGRMVARLLDEVVEPGGRDITWDGTDARGVALPSGVYFIRLKTDSKQTTRKLTLIR